MVPQPPELHPQSVVSAGALDVRAGCVVGRGLRDTAGRLVGDLRQGPAGRVVGRRGLAVPALRGGRWPLIGGFFVSEGTSAGFVVRSFGRCRVFRLATAFRVVGFRFGLTGVAFFGGLGGGLGPPWMTG